MKPPNRSKSATEIHTWHYSSFKQKYPMIGVYLNIAIENGQFVVDLPIKDGDLPELCKRLPEGSCYKPLDYEPQI